LGTHNCLGLALAEGALYARLRLAQVYGDPLVHPQHEEYRGNVSTPLPRSVYEEAKRYAEALTMAYLRLETRIVRIFNSQGPRLRKGGGKMVPNFIRRALHGEPLTV
jgi:dTDP-glucose 4,6-dehydratase